MIGCSFSAQKPKPLKENTSAFSSSQDIDPTGSNKIPDELLGNWRPIFHSVADIYGRDTSEIKIFMKDKVYFGTDTVIIFGDTVYSPYKAKVEKLSKQDWMHHNIDAGKRDTYNRFLAPQISMITLRCKMKYMAEDTLTFTTTKGFSYDGKYLFIGLDGLDFLLERDTIQKQTQ